MTFSNEDISNDKEFKRFLRSKNLKKGSIRLYIHRLRMYCNFHDMTISELITEADEEQDEGKTKIRKRQVNDRVGDFLEHLKERKLASETINGYMSSVKAIYNYCDIDMDKIALPGKDKNKAFEKVIEYEEIRTAVRGANQRNRAIFLTHMSSGMSSAEIRTLKYQDFLNSLKEYTETDKYLSVDELVEILRKKDNIIPYWEGKRVKNDQPFRTFTSPEATRETLLYLKERKESNFPIESGNNLLFAGLRNSQEINERDYMEIFEKTNDKHNFGRKSNTYRRFTSHELRRFFVTSCMKAGVDKLQRDFMVGHSIDSTDAAYNKIGKDILKKQYRKALSKLTFDNVKNITVEDPEVKELRDELKKSKEFNEEMAKLLNNKSDFEKLPKPKGL